MPGYLPKPIGGCRLQPYKNPPGFPFQPLLPVPPLRDDTQAPHPRCDLLFLSRNSVTLWINPDLFTMKNPRILGILAGLLIAACGGSKMQQDVFPSDQAWELAYLDSSDLGLEALFPDRMPYSSSNPAAGRLWKTAVATGIPPLSNRRGKDFHSANPGHLP